MSSLRAFVAALRPHQWTKNLLIFAPLALSKHLFEPDAFLRSVAAFALFCGLSGTAYLINDLTDSWKGVDKDNYFRNQYGPQPLEAGGRSAPRSATLKAHSDVRVLTIEGDAFTTILLDRPEVAVSVLKHMSSRVRDLNEMVGVQLVTANE